MSGTLHSGACKQTDISQPATTYLVCIAGSAGAFEPLCRLLSQLPKGFEAAVVAILHTGPGSVLAEALYTRSKLRVRPARSGDLLRSGEVYVPPQGTHVVVNPDARLTVADAPRRRVFRPSADWLFESATASFGDRHIAVVLSGMLSDGSQALKTVRCLGGTVLVQAPADARYRDMPSAAIATGHVDRIVPVADMARAIREVIARRNAIVDRARWEDPFDVEHVA